MNDPNDNGLSLSDAGAETTCPVCGATGYVNYVHPASQMTYTVPRSGYVCFDYDIESLRQVILTEQTPLQERDDMGLYESELDKLKIAVYYHPDE